MMKYLRLTDVFFNYSTTTRLNDLKFTGSRDPIHTRVLLKIQDKKYKNRRVIAHNVEIYKRP